MYCGLMSMGLSSIINSKERKGEKKRKKREKERKREKRREKERKGEKNMFRVNYYQSAFNSQKKYIGRNTQNLTNWLCLQIYI